MIADKQGSLFALPPKPSEPRPRIKMDQHRICWALWDAIGGVLVRSRATTYADASRLSAHYPGSKVSQVEEFSKGDPLFVEIPMERDDSIRISRSKPLSWHTAHKEFYRWERAGYRPRLVTGK